jgi:NAD(P)-dependent dehydrogenase (short-subunit alcohol dehydrogenase family)
MKPPTSLFDLTGRVAMVTGGGGSLGSAICEGLARAGAAVVVVDMAGASGDTVAARIRAGGGRADALAVDVSDEKNVAELFARFDALHPAIDILVNGISAAIERFQPEAVTLASWRHMLDTNLTGYFLCLQEAGRRMIARGQGGSIINIGSIGGMNALGRGAMAYGVAKAGVGQLTREAAVAWARHDIRVNALLPCQFTNKWWEARLADPACKAANEQVLRGIPMGRLGRPDEMIGPVLFLASPASSMVTGALIPVDGGNLALNAGGSVLW